MRHRNSGRQLSRNASHRHAMLRNMATSLLQHETIRTTVPKAKELRRVVEPSDHAGQGGFDRPCAAWRTRACAMMNVVEKLFEDLGPRFKARAGGYTRILKMEPRPGDSADMALMQLVDSAPVGDRKEGRTRRLPRHQRRPKAPKAKPRPRRRSRKRRQGTEASPRRPPRLTRKAGKAGEAEAPQGQGIATTRRTRRGSYFPALPRSSRHCLRCELRRRASVPRPPPNRCGRAARPREPRRSSESIR